MNYTISQLEALYVDFLRQTTYLSFFDYLRYLEAPKGILMKDCPNSERINSPIWNTGSGKWEANYVYLCNATTCTCIDNPVNNK